MVERPLSDSVVERGAVEIPAKVEDVRVVEEVSVWHMHRDLMRPAQVDEGRGQTTSGARRGYSLAALLTMSPSISIRFSYHRLSFVGVASLA